MRSIKTDLSKEELWEKEAKNFKASAAFQDKYINSEIDPKTLISDLKKRYKLWVREGLPLSNDALVAEYLASELPVTFVAALKKEANDLIRDGFDPKDARQSLKAFIGVRAHGIDIELKEFEERVVYLLKYDEKYPGYFKSLFTKTRALRPIEISTSEAHEIDTSGLKVTVFDEHLAKLRWLKWEIDSLSWFGTNLPGHKQFNPRNFYHRWKREEAIEAGIIQEIDRFNVKFPSLDGIKEELLRDKRKYYIFVFKMAQEKLPDRKNRDKYLGLMKDLIISDILEDSALVARLTSPDIEQRVVYYKMMYEDYVRHLPNAAGYRPEEIHGLMEVLGEFSRPVCEECVKVSTVNSNDLGRYTLRPAGFLGVFRGRAGIIDSTFNLNDGALFTHAMHEDTLFYLVRKGKELKGYVGLMWGLDDSGRKVLTVDVIQSSSLDGRELLMNLFAALDKLSRKNGGIGIALPEMMEVSFNFDNKNTICDMPIYREAIPIDITIMHKESWDSLMGVFGNDPWGKNTIENGKFELLVFQDSRILTQTGYRKGRAIADEVQPFKDIASDEAKRLFQVVENIPSFEWKYKKTGADPVRIASSDKYGPGLKGFIRSFKYLGGFRNWGLAFHAGNNSGKGDVFTYLEAVMRDIPEFSELRDRMIKEAELVPAGARLTDKVRRDLMVLGLVDGALIRLEDKAKAADQPVGPLA
ncbi:MAG: hypothetical protein HQL30_05145 [Candidatus Omnitrophica bacterium]|nr:hypothetical protein [Candidatus Omnitrophota bacterium]